MLAEINIDGETIEHWGISGRRQEAAIRLPSAVRTVPGIPDSIEVVVRWMPQARLAGSGIVLTGLPAGAQDVEALTAAIDAAVTDVLSDLRVDPAYGYRADDLDDRPAPARPNMARPSAGPRVLDEMPGASVLPASEVRRKPFADAPFEVAPGVRFRSFEAAHLLWGSIYGSMPPEDLIRGFARHIATSKCAGTRAMLSAVAHRLTERLGIVPDAKSVSVLASTPQDARYAAMPDAELVASLIHAGQGIGLGTTWGTSPQADMLWAAAGRMLRAAGFRHPNDMLEAARADAVCSSPCDEGRQRQDSRTDCRPAEGRPAVGSAAEKDDTTMATIKLVKAQIREPQNPGSKVKSYVDAFGSVNGGSLQGIKIFDAEQVADFRRAMDAHGEISKAKPFEMQANVQFKDGQAIVQSGSGQKADLQGVELTAARVFDTKSEDAKGKHIVDARGTYNGKSIRVKAFGQQAEDLIEAGIRDVSEAAPVTLASARGFFKDEEFKGSDGEMKKARHLHLQEVEIQTPALAPTPF